MCDAEKPGSGDWNIGSARVCHADKLSAGAGLRSGQLPSRRVSLFTGLRSGFLLSVRCFDAFDWATGKASGGPVKIHRSNSSGLTSGSGNVGLPVRVLLYIILIYS